MDFKAEYLSVWSDSIDRNYQAYKLYVKYEYECEVYDQKVSDIRDEDGFAVPISSKQHRIMNSNAMFKLDLLSSEKKRLNIGHNEWLDARKQVNRLSFEGLKDEYKRIFID